MTTVLAARRDWVSLGAAMAHPVVVIDVFDEHLCDRTLQRFQ